MQLSGFICPSCNILFALEDGGEVGYIEALLRGKFLCPRCSLDYVKATLATAGFREIVQLGPLEMWNYLNGLGLASEQANPKTVELLLLNQRIVDVGVVLTRNPSRCVVDHLRLDNGKVLHFTASGDGAMIYKITEEEDAREGSELRDHKDQEGPEEYSAGGEAHPSSPVADH